MLTQPNTLLHACLRFLAMTILASVCLSTHASPLHTSTPSIHLSSQEITRFTHAISHIKHYYIKSVSDHTLFSHAIEGMLRGLDPHSSYLSRDDVSNLRDITTGNFSGIGIQVIPEEGFVKIISPIDDTPAAKAGLKPGDLIVKIDHTLLRNIKPTAALQMIRGRAGTHVKLVVLRKKASQPLIFDIKRGIIPINTIKSNLLLSDFGYIRISFFHASTCIRST